MDVLDKFKEAQKQGWAHFAPLELFTTAPAARLVKHAGIRPRQLVLDVACGTGVVAVTASRRGALVTGLDLTPELLDRARENARMSDLAIDFHEGDVEKLPFANEAFDTVVSQFGHMFAPRPDVAIAEMLRVLKQGGTIAFSTWPPELFVGRSFLLVGRYMPPPPPGITSPTAWGEPTIVGERLGSAVRNIVFDRAAMLVPALSPQHYRSHVERTSGPILKLVEMLGTADPSKLAVFRREYEALTLEYLDDNVVRLDYLLTRATKV